MANIQQGIKFHMPISIGGIDLADVEKIEFLFKKYVSSASPAIKSAVWLADGTGTAVTGQDDGGNECILIPWTREDTFLFDAGNDFYLHARVHYAETEDEPYVPIVKLTMGPSLFTAQEVDA
jgi:hypothetical protein